LVPFFPPIRGVVAHRFQSQRSFTLGTVNALPFPSNPFQIIVFGQTRPPEATKKTCGAPLLKMTVNRCGAAKTFGQGFPLAAGPQDIHDGSKHVTRSQGFTPASWTPLIFSPFGPRSTNWNQRLNPRPEFV
jgi:hypothetical protein